MTKELKKLQPDKSVIFRCPIEGDDVLVRTGVIRESSFFHCLLHAYSKDYSSFNEKERCKLVNRLRSSLAGKIDRESWEEIENGLIAKIPFQENIENIICNCYYFLNDDPRARGDCTRRVIKKLIGEDEKKFNEYKLITELIPLNECIEEIFSEVWRTEQNQRISELYNTVINETISYLKNNKRFKKLSKEKYEIIRSIISKFFLAVMKEADDESFKNYVSGSQNLPDVVNAYTTYLVSKRFKRDIYFLDAKNRMPYSISTKNENLKIRKSIIIISLDDGYYEIVGKLLPGNRIQREFDSTDPIIEKLYTFLVNPEKIPKKYKDLSKYLPNNDLDKNSDKDSDKDSNDDSNDDSDKNSDNDSDNDSDKNSNNDSDNDSD